MDIEKAYREQTCVVYRKAVVWTTITYKVAYKHLSFLFSVFREKTVMNKISLANVDDWILSLCSPVTGPLLSSLSWTESEKQKLLCGERIKCLSFTFLEMTSEAPGHATEVGFSFQGHKKSHDNFLVCFTNTVSFLEFLKTGICSV